MTQLGPCSLVLAPPTPAGTAREHRPREGVGRPPLAFLIYRTTDVSRWRDRGPGTNGLPPRSYVLARFQLTCSGVSS